MNALESRIHSDAVSAAAEIMPSDIPALCLDRVSRGRVHHGAGPLTSAARPAGQRRWLAPLGAAAAVVAVIAAMVIVGIGSRSHSAGVAAPAASTSSPAQSSAQAAALATAALDYYFPATGAQYTDGWAFRWEQLTEESPGYDGCMARAGFPVAPFNVPEQTFVQLFPDNSVFPDLGQRAQTDSMTGPGADAKAALPTPASPAGASAARGCQAAAEPSFTEISSVASPLQAQWMQIVTTVQHSTQVTATQPSFSACLETHAVPASFAQQTDASASNPLFYGFFAWADTLAQQAGTSAQQTANDHQITHVFVNCAGPVVTVVEQLQLTQRATFLAQHAAQVSRIEALAERVLSRSR